MNAQLPELRPDARAFLDLFNRTALAHLELLDPVEARRLKKLVRSARAPLPHNLACVRDIEPDPQLPRMRFYDARLQREPTPLMVFFYGGGFVLGDLESHHELCVALAEGSDLPLLAVDYRLAPEYPWPAAPIDAGSCCPMGCAACSASARTAI